MMRAHKSHQSNPAIAKACALSAMLVPSLLLAGCGSDGGGGVASTPAPVYKTLDQQTGTQTYQTVSFAAANTTNGVSLSVADAGKGLTVVYDPAAQSYTVQGIDVVLAPFTQDDYQAAHSTDAVKVYQRPFGAGIAVLTVARPQIGGVKLSYTQVTAVLVGDGSGVRQWGGISGVPTQAGDLPRSGTASYTANLNASITRAGQTFLANSASGGTATFSADFGANHVATTLRFIAKEPSTGQMFDYGTLNGSGTIATGTTTFSGKFDGITDSRFSGGFFGPQGAEMGFAFGAQLGGTDRVFGTVAGKKN